MRWLTYVFPVVTLLFILLFYSGCPDPAEAVLAPCRKKSFGRRDALVLSGIVLVYSLVAFTILGDTEAPQSFYHFRPGEEVILDLGEEKTVGSITGYMGLNTGKYTIESSVDGASWRQASVLEQGTASLFKWEKPEFTVDTEAAVRYIRFRASADLYLGEVAVRDENGILLTPVDGPAELFDEQELVPDYPYYLNSSYFDEIYHARTALEHIEGIYPYEVSHPPLGKLIIALGIKLFGMTPFGWRFSGTLFGVLMLPVLYVFLKRMFGSIAVPACGTAIFAFDFMHFTQTRIATIDTYGVFFMLLMYLFMYLYVSGGKLKHLALSGVFFGIGAACKWTCIYAGAGLAVIWLIYRIERLKEGEGVWALLKNCLFCVVFFVLIPCIIYYLSYFAYGTALGMSAPEMFFDKRYAKVVLDNQEFMFTYHRGVHSEHPYSSRWYMWLLDIRPILYYQQSFTDGTRSSFGAFVNPALCWSGLVAVFGLLYLAIWRRDKLSGFIVIAYLAQLVPWMVIGRVTFEYHYFQSSVFLVFALCRVFSLMRENTEHWRLSVYGFTGLCLALFVMFYPVLSGLPVNSTLATHLLKWLPTWPF